MNFFGTLTSGFEISGFEICSVFINPLRTHQHRYFIKVSIAIITNSTQSALVSTILQFVNFIHKLCTYTLYVYLMHVHVPVCIFYTCPRTRVYGPACTFYTFSRTHEHMLSYTCTPTHVHVHMFVHMYARKHTHLHMYVHMYTYTCTRTHVHVQTYTPVLVVLHFVEQRSILS